MHYEEQIRIPFDFFEDRKISITEIRLEVISSTDTQFWSRCINEYRGYNLRLMYGDILRIRGVDMDLRDRIIVILIEYEKEVRPHHHEILPQRLIRYKPTIKVKTRTVRCL